MHPRLVQSRVRDALEDTRVVLIAGPRQSGKTTLAMQLAQADRPFLTLDDPTQLAAARSDPTGFIRGLDKAVIDEVQRAPDLLLAIKAEVDRDPRPGRFLLTGSANLMVLPKVAESLAGRMEVIRLLPLAQAEMRQGRGGFIADVFARRSPDRGMPMVGEALVAAVLAGGYPEAVARSRWARRQAWHVNYVDAIVQRDVRDIAQIEKLAQMPKLLSVLAAHSGQLVNYSGFGAALGMNHVTTQKYMAIFDSLFLTAPLTPWFTNKLKRLTKSPKLHFLDSGLLAALQDVSPEQLTRDRTAFGALLETFVFAEIQKLASWSDTRVTLSHFRDKDGNEVDLVLQNQRGEVIGIEIKASATVKQEDFAGLRKLAGACGDQFAGGFVLYDHDQMVPFGDGLWAAPLSVLWA